MNDGNKIGIVCSPVQLTTGVTVNTANGRHYRKIKNKEVIDYVMSYLDQSTGIIIYGPEAYTSKIRDEINQEQIKKYKQQKYEIELRSKLY